MMTENWVNISLGSGFLPDGTKPLPEPMLTVAFFWEQFYSECAQSTLLCNGFENYTF